MTVVVGVGRHHVGGSAAGAASRFKQAAGLCTVISSFTFLFALVIGLIS